MNNSTNKQRTHISDSLKRRYACIRELSTKQSNLKNEKDTWAIVIKRTMEVVATFRQKGTANNELPHKQRDYFDELEVLSL